MSLPSASMKRPTVSRISESTVVVPLTARKSARVLISFPPVLFVLYAMPDTPLAHGADDARCGSNAGWARAARRFFLFGNDAATNGWVHFTWLMTRFAIQSVSTKASVPMLWFRDMFGRILAKYSLLSLMSSWYVRAIPVSFVKSVFDCFAMYSGQFEMVTALPPPPPPPAPLLEPPLDPHAA